MFYSTRRHLAAAAAVLSIAGLLLLVLGPALAMAAGNNVAIQEQNEKYHFVPSSLQVAVGSTVTWKNGTDAAHTVTADDDSTNSGQINPSADYSQTFNTAGTFAYHCTIHDYMHGTITVLAAGTTPPPTDTALTDSSTGQPFSWLSIFAGLGAVVVLGGWLVRTQLARKRQGIEP